MAGNSFGKNFRITSFGESHGKALGVIIDGCPSGVKIDEAIIQKELNRRRPGFHAKTSEDSPRASEDKPNPSITSRKEADKCEILSGVFEGKTTGTPIAIIVYNTNQISKDYDNIAQKFRPGHADYPYFIKYGIRDYRGGGRASGRETIARVASGAIAKEILKNYGIKVLAWTSEAAGVKCNSFSENVIEKNSMRACDLRAAEKMQKKIVSLKKELDSAGGIVSCKISSIDGSGLPVGLGNPVFDKLDSLLAYAMLSIGAIKGIEFGSGFNAARMKGSEHNDALYPNKTNKGPLAQFKTNNAGGVLGGLSTGDDILFNLAVKPVSSIAIEQNTIDINGNETKIKVHGRHDVCLCPRIVPVVEAMAALVILDLVLEHK